MSSRQTLQKDLENFLREAPRNLTQAVRKYWGEIQRTSTGLTTKFGSGLADGSPTGEGSALAGLQSSSARERWSSAAFLGRNSQRSSEAIDALVEALADPEEFVQWQAADALATQEGGRVFPILTELLSDPDPRKRAGAAAALGRLGGEAAALNLSKHVSEPDASVRAVIVSALGEAGDPGLAGTLTSLLADEDPEVSRAAAISLGQLGNTESAAALAKALAQPGQSLLMRRAAAAALVRVAHPDAQGQLLAALGDPDPQVRAYSARALGQAGAEPAQAALTALKADRTPVIHGTVGDAANEALALLERRGRQNAASPGGSQ